MLTEMHNMKNTATSRDQMTDDYLRALEAQVETYKAENTRLTQDLCETQN